MKKMLVIAICILLALVVVACGSQPNDLPQENANAEEQQFQIPNPFVDCATMDDAELTAGFSVTLPESVPGGAQQTAIRATENGMIEVLYGGEEKQACLRKGIGAEDISGDYNLYETTEEIAVGDVTVTVKGNGGKLYLATWTSGEYSFAVSVSDGLSQEDMTALVSQVA